MWFSGFGGDGKFTPGGTFTTYSSAGDADAGGIVLGSAGNMWIAGVQRITRLTLSGNITHVPITQGGCHSAAIHATAILGPDHNIWATDNCNEIVRVVPGSAPTLTTFSFPGLCNPFASPEFLSFDSRGNIWFTDTATFAIGTFSPSAPQAVTEFLIVDPWGHQASPGQMATGSDGAPWFYLDAQLVRVNTDNSLSVYCCGGDNNLSSGADGALWTTYDGAALRIPLPLATGHAMRVQLHAVRVRSRVQTVRVALPGFKVT